jgi:hypothetical protein
MAFLRSDNGLPGSSYWAPVKQESDIADEAPNTTISEEKITPLRALTESSSTTATILNLGLTVAPINYRESQTWSPDYTKALKVKPHITSSGLDELSAEFQRLAFLGPEIGAARCLTPS